jgi:glycosyltransferase involved in cell wall biosynthesis
MSDERKGYQQAVIDALAHATKEWVFVVDSDYQFAAIDFWRLEPFRRDEDVILGIKRPRRDPFYRVWLSWGFNLLLRMFCKVPYRDIDTGFRLMRRAVVEKINPQIHQLSFFTAEFVVRAHYAGYRVREVPVHHYALAGLANGTDHGGPEHAKSAEPARAFDLVAGYSSPYDESRRPAGSVARCDESTRKLETG